MIKFSKIFAGALIAIFAFSFTGLASAAELAAVPTDVSQTTTLNELIANNNLVVDASQLNVQEAVATNATVEVVPAGQIVPTGDKIIKYETLPAVKNAASSVVSVTPTKVIVPSGSVFKVAFVEKFTTKNLKVGDKVVFKLPNGLYTKEGRMLLPCGTQIIACVKTYKPPKMWNRSARVYLEFNELSIPDTGACRMGACVFGNKYNSLEPSTTAKVLKPVFWTVGLFGVGAGLGAAIGAAAHAASIGCLAIGMPVGGGVGLLIGFMTPGLHYKAKAGKEIPIMLTQDMVFANQEGK